MKIIFFGTDDFAAAHLEGILSSRHKVVCVVTAPDRPRGRGMSVTQTSVKQMSLAQGIATIEPETLKESSVQDKLREFEADLFVVIAYGRILPQAVLSIPKLFAVNVHSSLLPQYRGAAPINWALINGDGETGLTLMKMDEKLDTGPVIVQEKIKIDPKDTAVTLRQKMIKKGPALLVKTLDQIEEAQPAFQAQDEAQATYAAKLTKEMGLIDWSKGAKELNNLVRGLLPWPTAYTFYQGKMVKLLTAHVLNETTERFAPGQVIRAAKDGFAVATGNGVLFITEVHPESSRPMSAHDFVIGQRVVVGSEFK